MNIFVGIEGHSFSGKTTLLNDLESTGNFNVIKEHDVYAGGAENFPSIQFKNYGDVKADILFFLDLEIKRHDDAKRLYEKNGKPTLFDRTVLSVVLFQKYLLDNKKEWLNGYKLSLEMYQEALDKKQITMPSRIIHLEPYDEETFVRRSQRSVSIDFYKTVETFRYMNNHYKYVLENYFEKGSYTTIKSTDGLNGRESVLDQTEDFLFRSERMTDATHLFSKLDFKI